MPPARWVPGLTRGKIRHALPGTGKGLKGDEGPVKGHTRFQGPEGSKMAMDFKKVHLPTCQCRLPPTGPPQGPGPRPRRPGPRPPAASPVPPLPQSHRLPLPTALRRCGAAHLPLRAAARGHWPTAHRLATAPARLRASSTGSTAHRPPAACALPTHWHCPCPAPPACGLPTTRRVPTARLVAPTAKPQPALLRQETRSPGVLPSARPPAAQRLPKFWRKNSVPSSGARTSALSSSCWHRCHRPPARCPPRRRETPLAPSRA